MDEITRGSTRYYLLSDNDSDFECVTCPLIYVKGRYKFGFGPEIGCANPNPEICTPHILSVKSFNDSLKKLLEENST